MTSYGWRMPKNQLRPHRVNARMPKKVALKSKGQRWIGFSKDEVENSAPKAHCLANALRTTRSTLQAHQLTHIFHRRTAVRDYLIVVFFEIEPVAEFFLFCLAQIEMLCRTDEVGG